MRLPTRLLLTKENKIDISRQYLGADPATKPRLNQLTTNNYGQHPIDISSI